MYILYWIYWYISYSDSKKYYNNLLQNKACSALQSPVGISLYFGETKQSTNHWLQIGP